MGRLHVELAAEATATGGTVLAFSIGDGSVFVPGATVAKAAAACAAWSGAISTTGATFATAAAVACVSRSGATSTSGAA